MEDIIRRLKNRVKVNVSSENGVTNQTIDEFTKKICCNYYKGTFPADMIPQDINKYTRFSIIVNLGTITRKELIPIAHFVAVIKTPYYILYIDSFGIQCLQQDVLAFMFSCQCPIYHNQKQIQDPKSMYCGLYAMLFCSYFDSLQSFSMTFNTTIRKKNDKQCITYLKDIINTLK